MIEAEMLEQKVTEVISISVSEYQDMLTKAADWDNLHIICHEISEPETAMQAIKAILGIWERKEK